MDYRIISLLDEVLGTHKEFSKGEFYYSCPFCHHKNKKLAINVNKLMWHCWTCSKSGKSLLGLLRKIDTPRTIIDQLGALLQVFVPPPVVASNDVMLPSEYTPILPNKSVGVEAYEYLKQRGITDADILLHKIGFCVGGRFDGMAIIPSRDKFGELNFFVGRRYKGTGLKYLIPENVSKDIIGFERFINFNYPVVLVEGVFDALAVKRNAIPLFGKTVPAKLKQKLIEEGVKAIYLALDNDALAQSIRVAQQFMNENIDVYLVKLSGKDPSEIGFEKMCKLIMDAKKLTFASLINLKLSL